MTRLEYATLLGFVSGIQLFISWLIYNVVLDVRRMIEAEIERSNAPTDFVPQQKQQPVRLESRPMMVENSL